MCAIPPISWPNEDNLSLSISDSCVSFIWVIYSCVKCCILLNAIVRSPSSSFESKGSGDSFITLFFFEISVNLFEISEIFLLIFFVQINNIMI